ncbi:MAG: hypothetical protein KF729_34745, partial [Sandaracinaceae bacterium]|nr:hypothetical protein [Sandaracinaceae bacterium]
MSGAAHRFGRIEPERLLETHLARALFAAQRAGTSGVLTVDEGELTMHVHLTGGAVTYVDRGALAETLGRLLLRQGAIDREEYGLILEQMAEPTAQSEVRRFGEVAIQLGMLTEEELDEALHAQVASKLQHCLTLDQGEWHLDESEAPSPSRFAVALEPTLRTALLEDPQSYRWPGVLVAKRTRKMRLRDTPEAIAARFGMSADELRLLSAMEGRPLADLLASRVLPPEEAGVVAVLLLFADLLDLDAPASLRLDREATASLRSHLREPSSAPVEATDEMDAVSVAVAVREAHEAAEARAREAEQAEAERQAFERAERRAEEEARAAAAARQAAEARARADEEATARAWAEELARAEDEARRAEEEAASREAEAARAR